MVRHFKEVLAAIDHLRSRKARPDASRITHYLRKKHGISYKDGMEILEECANKALVLKVEYKGYISYRDPSKSAHGFKQSVKGNIIASLIQIFGKMVIQNPEIGDVGMSIQKFKEKLLDYSNTFKIDEKLDQILDIAITNGYLTLLPNKNIIATNYLKEEQLKTNIMVKTRRSDSSDNQIDEDYNNDDDDASDIHHKLEESSNDSKSIADPNELYKCLICRRNIIVVRLNKNVIECRQCLNKCHLKCVYSMQFHTDSKEYTCPDCKTCAKCNMIKTTAPLINCVKCGLAYHRRCHTIKIEPDIDAASFWICQSCTDTNDANNILAKSLFFCTPGVMHHLKYDPWEHTAIWNNFKHREFGSNNEEEIDYEIPDVTDWSCEQIYAYFEEKHNGGALALKERNINGSYLLKMSRVEVIQGLGLTLGPALKLFKEIVILQKRRDDQKLYNAQ